MAELPWRRPRGRWIVRVSEADHGGVAFWRSPVDDFTGGEFAESRRAGKSDGWIVLGFDGGSGADLVAGRR